MTLKPIANNRQRQSLTVALRNICREYPAGGTVLRELLQNADDAGATEVRFVLDDRTHPTGELIDTRDFESISRLGDSLKLNDGLTTGKFGRGFNSVYNWTDSPSIVSRNRLLILDPHEEWSSGGDVYDFVATSNEAAMQNHMAAFKAVINNVEEELQATTIRIPLRTPDQAAKSDISSRVTTASEVSKVLRSFASEFGNSGLLFMRSVERIQIRASGISIDIEMLDGKALRSYKAMINNAVKVSLNNSEHSFDVSFQAAIEVRDGGESTATEYAVHHSIQSGTTDRSLRDWARGQKFIPWVAVAARLPVQSENTGKGSLFTVLPLPIGTNQPVHIHGLFSLSPDRASLHKNFDKSSQDNHPAMWNAWLLEGVVPVAWTNLLQYLAKLFPFQSAFGKWPHILDDDRDPLNMAINRVIEISQKDSLALWSTDVGYRSAADVLLHTKGADSTYLRQALQEAGVPVLFDVPQHLEGQFRHLFKDQVLCPKSLSNWLKGKESRLRWRNHETRYAILEYLLSEPGFVDYHGLEIFPFKDGTHRAIGETIIFIHRDKFEEDLFSLEDSHNLDLERLSKSTQLSLKQLCGYGELHQSIRYRSTEDLKKYYMSFIFNKVPNKDIVKLDVESTEFVSKAWTWMTKRNIHVPDAHISRLWLLPLSNGLHRRIQPDSPSSQVFFAPKGEIGDLMWRIDAKYSTKRLPLVEASSIEPAISIISTLTNIADKLYIKHCGSIISFLQWLHETSPGLDDTTAQEKIQIAKHIALHSGPLTPNEWKIVLPILRSLKIFQRVTWTYIVEGNRMETSLIWTDLNSCAKSVGLLDGSFPAPDIKGVQYLVADKLSPTGALVQDLKLVVCMDAPKYIEGEIIPAWKFPSSRNWPPLCKKELASFILRHFSSLSPTARTELRSLPIVPVSQLNGGESSTYAQASDLIDPFKPELRAICFDDEEIVPEENFLKEFGFILREYGLKTEVDENVVEHRCKCYAASKHTLEDIRSKAEKLLKSNGPWGVPPGTKEFHSFQHQKWLPTCDRNGTVSLKASGRCRSRRERLLVSSQLPILTVHISSEWEARLGWHENLPKRILMSQLAFGVQSKDRDIVDAVLDYISQKGLLEQTVDELMGIRCVLTSNGTFSISSRVFRPPGTSLLGCERLQPYLANVDYKFWDDHKDLLIRIGVRDEPRLLDLMHVQELLEAKQPLEEPDIAVALEVLHLALNLQPGETLEEFKVVSESGMLHPAEEIFFDDLGGQKSQWDLTLTHPHILRSMIKRLGVGKLSDRQIVEMLEMDDNDDEEFDQREDVKTRIADTLERYSVDKTFREYLANADDAKGASQIAWLLDERSHPCDRLLTPEMKHLQGPALLVHNDGVFSEDDLKGFKNVGEGSKAGDKEANGQFGRGSQTMFHWTDVPMILSGSNLLILDPQQQVLPKSPHRRTRKPGVKLDLARVRSACKDQLVPFEGLWEYTHGLNYYPGTIFRFPLRTPTTKSILTTSERHLDFSATLRLMENYFNEARISLLFLRRIESIKFNIHGKADSSWYVTRLPPSEKDSGPLSQRVVCEFGNHLSSEIKGSDQWWVSTQKLNKMAQEFPNTSRRVMKNAICGIAALITSEIEKQNSHITPAAMESKIFNSLPLSMSSDLPVHINAAFALSGDRQSIAVDEFGIQSHGSDWNRHLLEDALPKLYLEFLSVIGRSIPLREFTFWPREEPPKRTPAELLCTSFWQEVGNSSLQLFPKFSSNPKRSEPAKLVDFNQAVFDFLLPTNSTTLAPLLVSLELHLIRNIPKEIVKHLKVLPEVQSVTGPLLRYHLKKKESKLSLEKMLEKDPSQIFLDVLFRTIIPSDGEFDDLNNCQILPLKDGSFKALKMADSGHKTHKNYYVAEDSELKLFKFASNRMVTAITGKRLQRVIQSGKFNLAYLGLCHVKELLGMRTEVVTPYPESDNWLAEFWDYWNRHKDYSKESSLCDELSAKVFKANHDGISLYTTPKEFYQFPGIVEPSVIDQQQLCEKIPGLYLFNPRFMPKTLITVHKSLSQQASFCRFIRALWDLGRKHKKGIANFIKIHLEEAQLKILRNLVIPQVVACQILSREAAKFSGLSIILQSLPLWPNCNDSTRMVSANVALLAASDRLLVPWINMSDRFVNAQIPGSFPSQDVDSCLARLGAEKVPIETLLKNFVLPLPSNIGKTHWQQFRPLIETLSGLATADPYNILPVLRQKNIAVNGSRKLKEPNELYDHADEIFASAFRHETDIRFLHKCVRSCRPFYLKVGLRHRQNSLISATDYAECLQAISDRLAASDRLLDHDLGSDTKIVLSPLITSSSITQRFTHHDWQAILRQKVFQSRSVFNSDPDYRRGALEINASADPLLCLSEIISDEYFAVCWSQTSFPMHQPTVEALNETPGKGRPSIDMAWRHLQHLRAIVDSVKHFQLRGFLSELSLTYEFLQDHYQENQSAFDLKTNAVWLNVDDHNTLLLDDVKTSWYKVDELVLSSSCDAGPMKAVRPGLMLFEKLLRGLGCNTITYPTVNRPELHLDRSLAKSLRQLREEGKLLDITYVSEGREVGAHRIVLAAMSKMCEVQFSGRWGTQSRIEYDEDQDPDNFLSYHTLSTMINYAYEDEIDWKEMEVSDEDDAGVKGDKLNLLLDLLKGADYWIVPTLKSQVEDRILVTGRAFINLENVIEVRLRAEEANAEVVEELCAKFIRQNRDAVNKAHGSR